MLYTEDHTEGGRNRFPICYEFLCRYQYFADICDTRDVVTYLYGVMQDM